MKILTVVSYFPMPQDHGDALRRLMVLQALQQDNALTVSAAYRTTTTDADVVALKSALPRARVLVGELAPIAGPSLVAKLKRTALGPLRATPPWIFQHWSPSLADALGALDDQFDAVVLVGEGSGLYASMVAGPHIVWDKSNVLVASDLSTLRSQESIAARLRALVTIGLTKSFEKRILRRADVVWVTTAEEDERLARHYARRADAIIPSCVPLPAGPGVQLDPAGVTSLG